MSKKLFFFALLLFAAMSMTAQSLVGQWTLISGLEDDELEYGLVFGDDNTMMFSLSSDISEDNLGTIGVTGTIPGTYEVDGDQLSIALDTPNAALEITKKEWSGEMKAMLDEQPELEIMIDGLLEQVLDEAKKNFVDKPIIDGAMEIVTLDDDLLKLKDIDSEDDEVMVLKRAQTAR